MTEFRLLGPVQVRVADRLLDTGTAKQRGVLAVLLLEAANPVGIDTLIGRVWDEAPPGGARNVLYGHVSRIRRLLGTVSLESGRPVSLVRRSGGYAIDLDLDRVDVHRARRLVQQAMSGSRDERGRAGMLGEAFALWRGEPLSGIAGSWMAGVRQHLRQQQVDLALRWADLQLRLADPAPVVDALGRLVADDPLHESLTEMLMRALHACGRSVEALGCYTAFRRRMAEELGLDPGTGLQQVHRMILLGDCGRNGAGTGAGAGDRAVATGTTAGPGYLVPAQLPPDPRGFSGRGVELGRLDTLLADLTARPTAAVISAIHGTAGVGKTALAVHWAHRVRNQFPDGQLYVNLRGFDPSADTVSASRAVRWFLDALDVPPERVPADLDAQAALYRSVLAGRQMLIVLDNARDAEHVRPLLPGTRGCLVLVTSRDQLPGLVITDGAEPLPVDVLSTAEANELLARRLGRHRVAAEPAAVVRLVDHCARLPLALAVVAALAASRPEVPLDAFAEQLQSPPDRLDVLATGEPATDLRALFARSHDALTPAAARLFRLLGPHCAHGLSMAAAASIAGHPLARTRSLLAELSRANLVAEHAPGRYILHDLLRAYAAERAESTEPDDQRRAAGHRMVDFYLHSAYRAATRIEAKDPIVLGPAQPGVIPEEFADTQQALAWFTVEHPMLLATLAYASAAVLDTQVWQLAWSLVSFFDWRGHWLDLIATQRAAIAAARRTGDRNGEARALRCISRGYIRTGRLDLALDGLHRAVELYHGLDEPIGAAYLQRNLAYVLDRMGRHHEAIDHDRQALELFETERHVIGQVQALNGIGWYHAQLGSHREALAYCGRALDLAREIGNRYSEAAISASLGYAHHHLGDTSAALARYRCALDLYQDLGHHYDQADTLIQIGDTHHSAGNPAAAHDAYRQALTLLDELDHPDAERVRTRLHELDTPTVSHPVGG